MSAGKEKKIKRADIWFLLHAQLTGFGVVIFLELPVFLFLLGVKMFSVSLSESRHDKD